MSETEFQVIQSTWCSVDEDVLRRALSAAEYAKEWASELLATHDANFGRTTVKNKMWANILEESKAASERSIKELREALRFDAPTAS